VHAGHELVSHFAFDTQFPLHIQAGALSGRPFVAPKRAQLLSNSEHVRAMEVSVLSKVLSGSHCEQMRGQGGVGAVQGVVGGTRRDGGIHLLPAAAPQQGRDVKELDSGAASLPRAASPAAGPLPLAGPRPLHLHRCR
jgi:hypothetical protein